jgi:hypothetical protein
MTEFENNSIDLFDRKKTGIKIVRIIFMNLTCLGPNWSSNW